MQLSECKTGMSSLTRLHSKRADGRKAIESLTLINLNSENMMKNVKLENKLSDRQREQS